MLRYEIREINIDLEGKKTLLKWIVFCEVVHNKNITSFNLYYNTHLTVKTPPLLIYTIILTSQ